MYCHAINGEMVKKLTKNSEIVLSTKANYLDISSILILDFYKLENKIIVNYVVDEKTTVNTVHSAERQLLLWCKLCASVLSTSMLIDQPG